MASTLGDPMSNAQVLNKYFIEAGNVLIISTAQQKTSLKKRVIPIKGHPLKIHFSKLFSIYH